MKVCKYCDLAQPDDVYDICKIIGEKVYRRLKCRKCKRKEKNIRRKSIRKWLDDYKKELLCARCRFADFRALTFYHALDTEKDFNVADMISAGSSIQAILKGNRKM